MKTLQADFCKRSDCSRNKWPRGAGAFSRDFTIKLTSQYRALRTGTTTDWCILCCESKFLYVFFYVDPLISYKNPYAD